MAALAIIASLLHRNSNGHHPYTDEESSNSNIPKDDVKEQIVNAIGSFGPWQMYKCMFIGAVVWLPSACNLLNMVFYRAETDFWCQKPDTVSYATDQEWRALSHPGTEKSICDIYNVSFEQYQSLQELKDSDEYQQAVSLNLTKPCETFAYDRSFWKRTIIQEWDLESIPRAVCDKKASRKLTQQVTFLGLLMGVFITGILSDRIGRVPSLLLLIAMDITCGIATAFAPSYTAYLIGVWASGFAGISIGTVMYCWMMEILVGKEKTLIGCLTHWNWALGGLIVAGIAYLVPDWHKMELIFSIPWVLLLVATYFILPESPRWLLTHNKLDRAETVLRKAAAVNGRPLDDNFKLHPHVHSTGTQRGHGVLGFIELFRSPNMRKKTLIVYYLWFTSSVVYYGLTLNSNKFGASLFVYFTLGKVIEFPAIGLLTILVLKSGRRISLMTLYLISGVALVSAIVIPKGVFPYEWPVVALNILGRGSGVGCFVLCYVYSAEVFPTVVRNVGMGSSSIWARVGPMLVPYIVDLDYIEPRLPIVVFGLLALMASFLVTFLPETAHHKLPDTMEEGELAGQGDTLWAKCCAKNK